MNNLPTEIAAIICRHLDDSYFLSKLALCSRRLYQITLPFLYSHVTLCNLPQRTKPTSTGPDFTWHRFAHLRTLTTLCVDNQSIAFYIKRLTLRGAFSSVPPPCSRRQATKVKLHESLQSQIELLSDGKGMLAAEWMEEASCVGGEDALLAVLITRLSRLEAIDIEFPIFHDRLKHLLDRAALGKAQLPAFAVLPNLETCCIGYGDGASDGALLSSVLGLPSIRSIYLHSVTSQQQYWSPYSTPEESDFSVLQRSTCAHLELRHCRIGARQLSHLLATPKSLRSFVYIESRDRGVVKNTSFPEVGRAILQQKDTLEEVWVDISHDYIAPRSWVLTTTDDVGPICSLSTCLMLKRLRIAAVYVFGIFEIPDDKVRLRRLIDLIPAAIEELSLTHCETHMEEVCNALEALLCARHQNHGFENLHMITMELSNRLLPSYEEQLNNIVGLARAFGIKLKLLNNHSDRLFKDYEMRRESYWGMNSETQWAPCSNKRNRRPTYEEIEVDFSVDNLGNAKVPVSADEHMY